LESLKYLLELVRIRDFGESFQLAHVCHLVGQECIHQDRVLNDVVQDQTADEVEGQLSRLVGIGLHHISAEPIDSLVVLVHDCDVGPR